MPNFTKISKEFREQYRNKFTLVDGTEIASQSKGDPVIFAYYYLGKTVRLHQAYIMERFLKLLLIGRVRMALCLARQLGKSIGANIILIWLCWYNKMPVTIAHTTIWYVISRDDDTATEFIGKIRMLLYEGDRHMGKLQEDQAFFTGSLKEPNNTQQITFLNDCFIKSVPPTKKALGKSASGLWIDEAHRLKCTEVDTETFFDLASPIVAETGGAIVLSSSPEGIIGFFYRAIDPEQTQRKNEYESIWWDHTIWDDGTKECITYQNHVQKEKERLTEAGRYKMWQQEYGALFTVTETSFFDHEDIENATKDTPKLYEYKDTPCSVGYDYGMKNSRTVITVRTQWKDKDSDKEEIVEVFQYRCPAGFDNNKLHEEEWEHSIQRLKERYNLETHGIYGDDCPPGNDCNNWFKEHSGLPLHLYNFRSDQMSKNDGINRNCAAYSYRSRMKEGKLKIPKWNETQQFEMKIVQETSPGVYITIKSPAGQLCDTFDSDMMACIPFLDMNTNTGYTFDAGGTAEQIEQEKSLKYDDFKALTDEECRQLIKDANEGLID